MSVGFWGPGHCHTRSQADQVTGATTPADRSGRQTCS